MRTKFKASDLKEAARNLHKGNYHILMLFGVADMLEEYACIRQKIDINKTIEVADEKRILWLNLETYSEIPVKNGTPAYAEGAEVMLFAWAIDSQPVQVWDVTSNTKIPPELRLALKNPDVLI